jgi:hypothetical protein
MSDDTTSRQESSEKIASPDPQANGQPARKSPDPGRKEKPWGEGDIFSANGTEYEVGPESKSKPDSHYVWERGKPETKKSYSNWLIGYVISGKLTSLDAPPDSSRPRVPVRLSPDHDVVCNQVTRSLSHDDRIFARGQSMAIVTRPVEGEARLPGNVKLYHVDGAPRIATLDDARLSRLITEWVRLYVIVTKTVGKGKRAEEKQFAKPVHPPAWLPREILAVRSWPYMRELSTVTDCPYVLPDGEIVSEPGYDSSTGALLLSSLELPRLPADTSRDQAMKSAKRLLKLVEKFPFKSEDDKVVWLTALLTAIQRPVIRLSVPGFAFNSNKAGTGKGILINIIGILVWGAPVPTTIYPEDSTEAEKLALSLALGGIPAVHLDNIPDGSAYGGAALDSALTCLVKGGRILGVSRCAEGIPLRTWWALSGNNVHPREASYRRWLVCNLCTGLERPHEREDIKDDDIFALVARHRGQIIADALTILRNHAVNGSPSESKARLGSFEEWDKVVRDPVWFATGRDCLVTQRAAEMESDQTNADLQLLDEIAKLEFGQAEGYTIKQLINIAEEKIYDGPRLVGWEHDDLRDALYAVRQKGDWSPRLEVDQLQYKFRALKDNPINGRKLVEAGKLHQVVRWRVVKT